MKKYFEMWRLILRGTAVMMIVFCWSCNFETSENDSKNEIQLDEGLSLDLVVKEPLVIDPVAFAFDESGFLFVVEDRGYPDPAEGGTPENKEGKVVRLEDKDGDGEYDSRTEFASGFTYPNGILPWKGGVFITCAPDIFYLKDTDGDGKADVRKVVLTGFKDTKTSQLRVSHPTLGLDGWVYVTSGLNGGDITSPIFPERDTVSFNASDGRFHPETFEFETVGGKSQFGLTIDAFGNRFGCSNRHPVLQVVIEPRFLNRNPYLSFSQTVKNASKVEAEAVVFPISNVPTTSDFMPNLMGRSHQGTFTSASSTFVFNGAALGEEYKGNVFICESAQNLVQRQVFRQDGASFSTDLVEEGREFLASKNEWFRPVYVNQGPDGGMYIADMHRKVIDHPSYVPEGIRDKLDFKSGKDMGRIYRIRHEKFDKSISDISWPGIETSPDKIIQLINSNEEWLRQTGFRLALQDKNPDLKEGLQQSVSESEHPESRVKALWLLHLINQLDATVLEKALDDPHAGVRGQAVLLCENYSTQSEDLKEVLLSKAEDSDPQVRFFCAMVLGFLDGNDVLHKLASLAFSDGEDPWTRAGLLSGVGDRMLPFLEELQKQEPESSIAYSLVMEDLGKMFGNGASLEQCRHLASSLVDDNQITNSDLSTLLGLSEGCSSREFASSTREIIKLLLTHSDQGTFDLILDKIIQLSENQNSREKEESIRAIKLLGYTTDSRSLKILSTALKSGHSAEIQKAAIEAISRQASKRGGKLLASSEIWKGFTPQVRSVAVSSMVSQPAFIEILLEGIEAGIISATDIPSVNRQRLIKSKDSSIRTLATEVFADLEGGDRMEIYENFKEVLEMDGDIEAGKRIFENICSVCHSYNGQGGAVGPDLTGIKNQPGDAILLHTLVPNYEVYPTYQTVSVQTTDGRSITGWILSETENSLTLRMGSGEDETILRSTISTLTNTGLSLMPNGLEQAMSKEELAGLIAYLKQGSTF